MYALKKSIRFFQQFFKQVVENNTDTIDRCLLYFMLGLITDSRLRNLGVRVMRVIAGQFKGRPLKSLSGKMTRPTVDKVKEAVFQIIGPYFDGGLALDLFAGSGALGIEALSRGMDRCIFVDKSPKAKHIIMENINALQLDDRAEVYCTEAFRALKGAAKRNLSFDLILLDPPYGKADFEKLLNQILSLHIVKKDGIIFCEHDGKEMLPDSFDALQLMKRVKYSSAIGVTMYQYKGEETDGKISDLSREF